MDSYEPPLEAPSPPKKPLRYRPRFGPSLVSLGLGLFVVAFANVVALAKGWIFRVTILINCLFGVGVIAACISLAWQRPNLRD